MALEAAAPADNCSLLGLATMSSPIFLVSSLGSVRQQMQPRGWPNRTFFVKSSDNDGIEPLFFDSTFEIKTFLYISINFSWFLKFTPKFGWVSLAEVQANVKKSGAGNRSSH